MAEPLSAEERQAALDNISAEDLAKIQKHTTKGLEVYTEDMLLAEFAMKFGWEAYKAVQADEIDAKEMMTLLVASRKIDAANQLRNAQAAFIGAGSAQSKKPSQTFKTMTSKLEKYSEADK